MCHFRQGGIVLGSGFTTCTTYGDIDPLDQIRRASLVRHAGRSVALPAGLFTKWNLLVIECTTIPYFQANLDPTAARKIPQGELCKVIPHGSKNVPQILQMRGAFPGAPSLQTSSSFHVIAVREIRIPSKTRNKDPQEHHLAFSKSTRSYLSSYGIASFFIESCL
jgi:hypothetical protein